MSTHKVCIDLLDNLRHAPDTDRLEHELALLKGFPAWEDEERRAEALAVYEARRTELAAHQPEGMSGNEHLLDAIKNAPTREVLAQAWNKVIQASDTLTEEQRGRAHRRYQDRLARLSAN